jgi:hypothetical protein
LGEQAAAESLKGSFVREFDITVRPMKGWVMVEEKAFSGSKLEKWLKRPSFLWKRCRRSDSSARYSADYFGLCSRISYKEQMNGVTGTSSGSASARAI